jgi:hypothetical protein
MTDENATSENTEEVQQDNTKTEESTSQHEIVEKNTAEEATETDESSDSEADKAAETAKKSPDKAPGWQTRIDKITAEKYEARNEAALLRREKEDLMAKLATFQKGNETEDAPQLTVADIEKLAQQRAEAIASDKEYTDVCNIVFNKGKEEFSDFDDTIQRLKILGDKFFQTVPIIIELDNSHKVLQYLGENLDEADEILSLPQAKRTIKLAQIEQSITKPKTKSVSNAPAPITPLQGKNKTHFDPNNQDHSMGDWIKWRESTARKR